MATVVQLAGEQRLLLRSVTWEMYTALRATPENNHVGMTYDEGNLELMSPSRTHERFAQILARLIEAWTEEYEIPIQGCKSTTFKLKELRKGLEPDECYYIQNEALVRDHDELDLATDPPPDLVIEVDITRPMLSKLPIYAAMRVPEIWRWRDDAIEVLLLGAEGRYATQTESTCLPGFPVDEAQRIIDQRYTADENTLIRRFRTWVRERIAE